MGQCCSSLLLQFTGISEHISGTWKCALYYLYEGILSLRRSKEALQTLVICPVHSLIPQLQAASHTLHPMSVSGVSHSCCTLWKEPDCPARDSSMRRQIWLSTCFIVICREGIILKSCIPCYNTVTLGMPVRCKM